MRRLPQQLATTVYIILLFGCLLVASQAIDSKHYREEIEPVLMDYCFDCHGEGTKKGSLSLDTYSSLDAHFDNKEMWLAIWKNLRTHTMPPSDKDQPGPEEMNVLTTWIQSEVFKVDPTNPDPGRVTIRRLNRAEYQHTIKDFLGVDFQVYEEFPADDTGYGFDTIGDALSMSPLLTEKYLLAAQQIAEKAVFVGPPKIPTMYHSVKEFRPVGDPKGRASLSFEQEGLVQRTVGFEHLGDHNVTVVVKVEGSTAATSNTAEVGLIVNGKKIATQVLGWDHRKSISLSGKAWIKKGGNQVQIQLNPGDAPGEGERWLMVKPEKLFFYGPLDGSHKIYPDQYKRIFFKGPPPPEAPKRDQYRKEILEVLANRAFRRPVDDWTLGRLIQLAKEYEESHHKSFEKGIRHALTAILSSPKFLFRAEIQPEPNNVGKTVAVDEFALASRLSYFLWSSLPDQRLRDLAMDGKLRENLMSEVDRMTKDWKTSRFRNHFVGQWLQTRDVQTISIDARPALGMRDLGQSFKVFSGKVRQAMKDETELLFMHLIQNNRPLEEFFTADYTFLNEPLARFYKIPGIKGDELQKVSLKPEYHRKGGVLAHGSFHIVTSNPTRTSPVKRGLYVLENLLGTPAPPAPDDVPELEHSKKSRQMTMREQMEMHRSQPLCKSCHARMDPIGLALENYTNISTWKELQGGKPIDTRGKLFSGESFDNVEQLATLLATERRRDFYSCVTEELMTYAIGRGMEYYDIPAIDRIVDRLEANEGKAMELIYGIVESAAFQKRRGDGHAKIPPSTLHKK